MNLNQEFNYFDNTNSGIYVFRPTSLKKVINYTPTDAFVFKGDLIDFITSSYTFEGKIKQTVTIFKKGDTQIAPLVQTTSKAWKFAELGFLFKVTDMSLKQSFYNHDSNEFIKRELRGANGIRDFGINIYPAIHGYAVKNNSDIFGIFNNYPTGCGYIPRANNLSENETETDNTVIYNFKEQVECFLSRNTNKDDDKGLPDILDDSRETTFSYFLAIGSTKNYDSMYQILSDYFNTPLNSKIPVDTSNIELDSSIACSSQDKEFVHKLDDKDYFYLGSSFTLLKDNKISKDFELFDLFQNHNKESFVRVRNREQKGFRETPSEGSKFDPETTFIFKLQKDIKYTMNGIQKIPREQDSGFIKSALSYMDKGYHFVRDDVLRIGCDDDKHVFLKPREIATLKISKK